MEEIKTEEVKPTTSKQCDVCFLLESTAKAGTKFFCYSEGFYNEPDNYICEDCLEEVKNIRKKCYLKIDNPHHDPFKDWIPWFLRATTDAQRKLLKIPEAVAKQI